ncbi:MAG TPA: ABC transporter substrate-binding protein [Planctomycetaceae bacterium]|nr:ABC transporter substrate-binding protein [Planctomycetaceae bacterium]|tara:strand:+ start:4295 stop:5614 length:1320 start_codon:yes stop_codon:yes gene_type:complete
MAFKSLRLHFLRSVLAAVGVLIGVTAVIWLVALGEGVSYQAQQLIKEYGATNIIIRSKAPAVAADTGRVKIYGLTRLDFDRITARVAGPSSDYVINTIERAVPMREVSKEIRYFDRTCDTQLLGVMKDYQDINHLDMSIGRFLSRGDSETKSNVAVLADGTARELFPYENPIGKTVRIDQDFYRVVGVVSKKQDAAAIGGSISGRSYDKDVYIPLNTFRSRIGDQVPTSMESFESELIEINQITVTVNDVARVPETAEIIRVLLGEFHNDANPDYSVTVPMELLEQAETTRMMFNILLVVIAGISLLVGGIGIMNIMLATVTERTREIGIRRALGATQMAILWQFLNEATVLTAIGGMLGIACGFMCYPVVDVVMSQLEVWYPEFWAGLSPAVQNIEPRVETWSVVAAFGISVGVGILFGVFPARQAAQLDPIEALRHE